MGTDAAAGQGEGVRAGLSTSRVPVLYAYRDLYWTSDHPLFPHYITITPERTTECY